MIEALGSSVISGVTTAGLNEFVSVLRNKPNTGFQRKKTRLTYTEVRGKLLNKKDLNDTSKWHYFQINPQTIDDVKNTIYEVRQYAGLSYNDYIWGGGGERTITFQLFLDDTPQSRRDEFRPRMYNSQKANEIVTTGVGYKKDPLGNYTLDKTYFGKGFVDEIKSQAKSIKESIVPSKEPSSFQIQDNGAWLDSRVDERGVLPEVEKIQSFLYPAALEGEQTPLFATGGIVNSSQFRPPPIVILSIGPIYMEGVVKSAPVKYTLFDYDLTPIRATIDIEFAVFEFEELTT